jgi:hypothetical protein
MSRVGPESARTARLPDRVLELIAEAEGPAEFAHLDDEVKDWKP